MNVTGKNFSDEEYIPIGNFFILEDDKLSPLTSETTTANVQEQVLKEPLRRTAIDDIRKGHAIDDYCAKLTYIFNKQQSLPQQREDRKIPNKDSLKPTSTGKASIIWTKDPINEGWTCRLLLLSGGHHLCLQPSASDVNIFGGFPFDSSSAFEIMVSSLSRYPIQ